MLHRDRGLVRSFLGEVDDDARASVFPVEARRPLRLRRARPERRTREPALALVFVDEGRAEPLERRRDGLRHGHLEAATPALAGRPQAARPLVADSDGLRPPPRDAVLPCDVRGDVAVRALARAPRVEDRDPLGPGLPRLLDQRLVGHPRIRDERLRLVTHDVPAGCGVPLAGPLHPRTNPALEVLLLGHLDPPSTPPAEDSRSSAAAEQDRVEPFRGKDPLCLLRAGGVSAEWRLGVELAFRRS